MKCCPQTRSLFVGCQCLRFIAFNHRSLRFSSLGIRWKANSDNDPFTNLLVHPTTTHDTTMILSGSVERDKQEKFQRKNTREEWRVPMFCQPVPPRDHVTWRVTSPWNLLLVQTLCHPSKDERRGWVASQLHDRIATCITLTLTLTVKLTRTLTLTLQLTLTLAQLDPNYSLTMHKSNHNNFPREAEW